MYINNSAEDGNSLRKFMRNKYFDKSKTFDREKNFMLIKKKRTPLNYKESDVPYWMVRRLKTNIPYIKVLVKGKTNQKFKNNKEK